MALRKFKLVVFALSFVILLVLYWPALSGTPIWDDTTFWFNDPVMNAGTPYWTIWKGFSWPVSVTIQKFLLSIWETNYTYYHVLSLLLHFANSLLVYRLGRHLQFRYPLFYFLLFLFHPIAVITTAWMVQLKTLLCFFFGLSSMLIYLKGMKDRKWIIPSWILFWASLSSKSASLPLAVILFFVHLKLFKTKKIYLLIPYFLLAGHNAYMILKSPVTTEGTEKAAQITKFKAEPEPVVESKPEPKPESKPEPKVEPKPEPEKPVVVKKESKAEPEAEPLRPLSIPVPEQPKVVEEAPMDIKPLPDTNVEIPPADEKTTLNFIGFDIDLIAQTMQYYFWQAVVPVYNQPVKGLNYSKAGITDLVHVIFLLMMVFIFWKDSGLLYLGTAHFMLLPFLGFIPAPFMNITWVSDQHLYLVLPALLAFWMRVIDKVPWKKAFIFPSIFLAFFGYKTYEATPMYQDQFAFYEESLNYNPYNVPIAYNLAYAYLVKGEWPIAYSIASDTYVLAEKEPLVKDNIYFPYLAYLYLQLKHTVEKNDKN